MLVCLTENKPPPLFSILVQNKQTVGHGSLPPGQWGRSSGTRWRRCCSAWRWCSWGWPSRRWTVDRPSGLDGGYNVDTVCVWCNLWEKRIRGPTVHQEWLLTEIVEAPLGAESDLSLQVVQLLRPQLQNSKSIADRRLGHSQLVLAWAQEERNGTRTHVHGIFWFMVYSVCHLEWTHRVLE